MIRFDLSSIPAGSTVSSATLQIYTYEQQGPLNHTVGVYKAARQWDESATWTKATATTNWSSAGGDAGANIVRVPIVGNRLNVWEAYTVTSAVAGWLANPSTNYGFFIRMESGTDGHGYYASEWSNQTLRPKLVITYEPPTAVARRDAPSARDGVLRWSDGALGYERLAEASLVEVFTLDGTLVLSRVVRGSGRLALSRAPGEVIVARVTQSGRSWSEVVHVR